MPREEKTATYKVKQRIKKGVCRIIEDGKGCKSDVAMRGLCGAHHKYFYLRDQLDKYGATPLKRHITKIDYKINKQASPCECRILEEGKICQDQTRIRRGLCVRHYKILFNRELLEDYGLPLGFIDIKTNKNAKEGFCNTVENGKICEKESHLKGMCRRHYRLASKK